MHEDKDKGTFDEYAEYADTFTIAFIGGKDFNDYPLYDEVMHIALSTADAMRADKPISVFYGDCPTGLDAMVDETLAEQTQNFAAAKRFETRFDRHGGNAIGIRNYAMLKRSDLLVAVWNGRDSEVKNGINQARNRQVTTLTFYYRQRRPQTQEA